MKIIILRIIIINMNSPKHHLWMHMAHTSTLSLRLIVKMAKYVFGFNVNIKSVSGLFRAIIALLANMCTNVQILILWIFTEIMPSIIYSNAYFQLWEKLSAL